MRLSRVVSNWLGAQPGVGVRFAFIDVNRTPTPRCAPNEFETTLETRANGGQVYGRETASGGGENWGYCFSYGARKGSDYRAGNDQLIPSSYESQDLFTEFGYDITPNQRLAFTFLKYDQANTEYPDQFFDIGHLGTYGFESRLVDDYPGEPLDQADLGRLVQPHRVPRLHAAPQPPRLCRDRPRGRAPWRASSPRPARSA